MQHDVYVWQRQWDESLVKAIRSATPSVRAWRVLVAEVDRAGRKTPVSVNWEVLRQTGRPIVAVVRMQRLSTEVLLAHWSVSGIEIDYDCATSQLPAYGEFLHLLRGRLAPGVALSITGLPSWMESGELGGVLHEVDESVLQVHSVMNARKGLFDRALAEEWTRQWSQKSATPFRVALPTYWSRVSWDAEGHVEAIESEVSRHGSEEGETRELFVDPREVSALVVEFKKAPVNHLLGIAWFRLPTSEDQRAWSSDTWHAVMQGKALTPVLPVVRIKDGPPGVRDLYLRNESGIDGRLPEQVLVASQGCELADALPPYCLELESGHVRFHLAAGTDSVLRAGHERMLGWVRCAGKEFETHVSF